jgi:hypothetical protein
VISSGGRRRSKQPRLPNSIATVMGTVAAIPASRGFDQGPRVHGVRLSVLQAGQDVDHDGEKYRGDEREQNHCEAADPATERSYFHIAPYSHCRRASDVRWIEQSSNEKR